MNMKKLVAMLVIASLVTGAIAQNQQGGQRQGGQRGQGGQGGQRGGGQWGGMMGGMRGGMGMSSAFLLQREDVQEELKLTDAQKSKLADMREKTMTRMREQFQGGGGQRGGGAGAGGGMSEAMQKMMEETQKELDAIITADQKKRLTEISIQMAGPNAVNMPEVSKALELTEDQKTKIADLSRRMGEANRAIMERVRSGELSREEMMETSQKNSKILEGEIAKVLTDTQKNKLKEMSGKPFVRNDN